MQLLSKKKRTLIISITSLIDVVLLLLIFFMLTTTFAEQPGMELDLPKTEGFSGVKVDKLEISINASGQMTLNGAAVTEDNLVNLLKEKSADLADKSITLKADKATNYGFVIKAMDKIKQSSIEKIVIATEQQE